VLAAPMQLEGLRWSLGDQERSAWTARAMLQPNGGTLELPAALPWYQPTVVQPLKWLEPASQLGAADVGAPL